MIIIGIILSVFGLGFFCWLPFTLRHDFKLIIGS